MTAPAEKALALRDRGVAADRLAQLQDSYRYAEYELVAGVEVARRLGLSWGDVADALGFYDRAHARKWFTGRAALVGTLDHEEHDRLARLVGADRLAVRWAVKVKGRNRVRRTVSTHLRREVAERRAAKLGDRASVWRVEPDGAESEAGVRGALPGM